MRLDAKWISAQVASMLDATLLKPEAVESDFLSLCARAREHMVRGVCVSASWLPLVVREVAKTSIKPVAVVGFPNGNTSTEVKLYEAQWCEGAGAAEIDMVVHLGHLKGGDWDGVQKDLARVISSVKVPTKVIFESHLLTPAEITRLCQICDEAGASFVKTSTGWTGGARLEDVKLMRQNFGRGVKASGGIRSWEAAKSFIQAGAGCIGTSSEAVILQELSQDLIENREWFENNPLPALNL